MTLIFQSLIFSIGVSARMIIPLFFIIISSVLVWIVLGVLTLGLSSYVSTSITTAFITLYGIKIALELKGDKSFFDLCSLATYSVAFGIILEVIEKIGVYAAGWLAILTTEWRMGNIVSLATLRTAEESIQFAFGVQAISFYALFSLVIFVAIQAAFAVPMAVAARSASKNATSSTFLEGFGSSFIPLFLIFLVSFFFQFFLKLYGLIIFAFGAMLIQLTRAINEIADYMGSQEEDITLELFSAFDLQVIFYTLISALALLWFQSLVWSAAALALLKHERKTKAQNVIARDANTPTSTDLRALRKGRGNRTD